MHAVREKHQIKLENRDGALFLVQTTDDRYFLVLEADTFHNAEAFLEMGSTDHVEIGHFAALALHESLRQSGQFSQIVTYHEPRN